ncbi:AfsR/SARP family transcriptional regulator [Flindersiella endophytica]
MRLRLLGPPELLSDGRSIDIGGPRNRVVLAVLALNANRTTPIERLIDAVWETSPPATARSQIQICVSALRKLFDRAGLPWAIRSRQPGYVLEIPPADLDAEEFGRLVALARSQSSAGRRRAAAETLRSALELWRGPALSGVPAAAVRGDVALLEEHRLVALEERIRLDLDLGRHHELSGELLALVEEHPLRERLHGLLMLALYRSGRQADALSAYRQARDQLTEQVGVEPGAELRALQQAILTRDPSLDPPAEPEPEPEAAPPGRPDAGPPGTTWTTPRQLPAGLTDFTGREEQLAAIRQALDPELSPEAGSPAAYAVPVVGISGPGGVGKTSLAIRAAHELTHAYPDGQLYVDLRTAGGDEAPARLLSRFLRALGLTGLAIPDDVDERATTYRSLLAGRRVLVVLDGVTREQQVELLLPGSAGCAVIATSRERLGNLPGLLSIDLDVFDSDAALELIRKVAGPERIDAEPEASAELVRFCDGLPLALRLASARLAGKRHWPVRELVGRLASEVHRLDELSLHGQELRSTIDLSHRELGEQEQRLFRLAAVVPTPDFPAWVAAALLDTDFATGQDKLENLVDAQLLTVVTYADQRPRYRFHDLVRVYASERLAADEPDDDRRSALERMLGGWLTLVEEAHLVAKSCALRALHGSAPRWRPSDVSLAELMGGDPYAWLERERSAIVAAIRQAADTGLDETCWNIVASATTLFELGHFDDWLESNEVALRSVEQAGNRLGRARMLHSFSAMYLAQSRPNEVLRYAAQAEREFRAMGNDHGLARSLNHQATAAGILGDTESCLRQLREVGKLLRAVGDEVGYAQTLRKRASCEIYDGNFDTARSMLGEALDIVRTAGDVRSEAMMLTQLGALHSQMGDIDDALASLRKALDVVRDIGDRVGEAFVLLDIGRAEHHHRRFDDAQRTFRATVEAASRVGEDQIIAHAWRALGEIATELGETATAVEHLENAHRRYGELGLAHRQAKTQSLLEEIRSRINADEGR